MIMFHLSLVNLLFVLSTNKSVSIIHTHVRVLASFSLYMYEVLVGIVRSFLERIQYFEVHVVYNTMHVA